MRLLWSFLIVDPLIILSTICCATVTAFASPPTQSAVARFWGKSLLKIARVRVVLEGAEHLKPGIGYVFASNHLSYMDTPVLLGTLPSDFRFLAKEGLFQIPFLGTHLKRAGHIAVPREDPRAALKTLSHAAKTMERTSILVFPEGGRSRTGELQPFEEGAAYLAIKAQTPLVPVALVGTREILPMGSSKFTAGTVKLKIGEPISTEGKTIKDRTDLNNCVRERIVEMLRTR